MHETIINAKNISRTDSENNLSYYNPVLWAGEVAYSISETGEIRSKIGNGYTPYKRLPFMDEVIKQHLESDTTLTVDGFPLFSTTFVELSNNGDIILREDGEGDYILSVTFTGNVFAKQIGKTFEDIESEEGVQGLFVDDSGEGEQLAVLI